MTPEQVQAKAEEIIVSGHNANASENDIMMGMFSAGIDFSKLKGLYKAISIAKGFIVDPKVVTAAIKEQVVDSDWAGCSAYEMVLGFADGIVEEVKGATKMRVMQLVAAHCKAAGITLPEAVKAPAGSRNRVGAVSTAAVDYFNSTQEPTKEGMFNAIRPHVKADKNAKENTNLYFNVMWAIRNSIPVLDAVKATSGMSYPEVQMTPAEAAGDETAVNTESTAPAVEGDVEM